MRALEAHTETSDEKGKEQTEYFEKTVSSMKSRSVEISKPQVI